jgi:hypothetical protein
MGQLKVNEACQSLQLAKIQGMKNISKPRLPIEIYTFHVTLSTDDFKTISEEIFFPKICS